MNQSHSTAEAEYTHLGAYFKSLREHYELDIQQVSARLHIRSKYIEALEAGKMDALPGKVYTQGYIHSYAEFLGLDPESVLAQYDGLQKPSETSQFRVVEPTQQQGMPAWRWVLPAVAGLLVVYLLIDWLSVPSERSLEQRIAPVPESIRSKAANALVLTDRNQACLQPGPSRSPLPCYYHTPTETIVAAFVMQPVDSIMELAR